LADEARCPTCDQALPGQGGGGGLPASLVAASRLEDASLVLLAFSYLTGALALLTGFAPLVAGGLTWEWKIVAALAGGLGAAVFFVTLKYVSEAMRALADVARAAARVEERLERGPGVRQGTTSQGVPTPEGGP
jgi:hypothetical protein